mgnify:CR=1 FL=1
MFALPGQLLVAPAFEFRLAMVLATSSIQVPFKGPSCSRLFGWLVARLKRAELDGRFGVLTIVEAVDEEDEGQAWI